MPRNQLEPSYQHFLRDIINLDFKEYIHAVNRECRENRQAVNDVGIGVEESKRERLY